jgi:RNA polymerase sigma factor (TIGR02999 family)
MGVVSDITQILEQLDRRQPGAADQLFAVVYEELRKLAAAKLAQEKPGQTLQATALVHEAYVRLVGGSTPAHFENRGHLFSAAAEAMRRILIDQARRKQSLKAGGNFSRVELEQGDIEAPRPDLDLLALDEALERLSRLDERKAELVKLRYFAGLTLEQAAQALGISNATADTEWAYAKAWLRLEVSDERGRRPPR